MVDSRELERGKLKVKSSLAHCVSEHVLKVGLNH